ncbi:MAG: cupin domain-containing protein [Planctomycetota bacterium]|nr:MAG: cupin domain-containing protein [Planctomycetota bacterium]
MNVTKIDDQALTTLVQCFTEVERVEHSWGWLKWLMNDKIDPKAEMTFGLVQINAGQENPLHTHPNCEEILYMLSGSCEHRIGDKTVMLEAGQMIRIPTGVPHRAKTAGSEPMRAVIVYSSGDRQFVMVEQ